MSILKLAGWQKPEILNRYWANAFSKASSVRRSAQSRSPIPYHPAIAIALRSDSIRGPHLTCLAFAFSCCSPLPPIGVASYQSRVVLLPCRRRVAVVPSSCCCYLCAQTPDARIIPTNSQLLHTFGMC